MDVEGIKKQIAVYDQEINGIKQQLASISNQIDANDDQRSHLSAPNYEEKAALIDSREQQFFAQRNQLAARLPQLEFERKRLEAMLNE